MYFVPQSQMWVAGDLRRSREFRGQGSHTEGSITEDLLVAGREGEKSEG